MKKKYKSAIRFVAFIIFALFLIIPLWTALSSNASFFAKMEYLNTDKLSNPESRVLTHQNLKVASASEELSSTSNRISDPAAIFLFGVGLTGISMFTRQKIEFH